jgi:hypothetical protein
MFQSPGGAQSGAHGAETMAKHLSTTYLYRNPRSSHFFFRIRIPNFLQGIVSRKELRYSLQTANLLEAEYRAVISARAVKRLFAALSRNWWWMMKEMTKEEIDYLVCKYMVDLLKYFEDYRVLHSGPEKQVEYDWNMMLLDKNLDEAQKKLILSDHEPSGEGFDDILSNWGGFEEIDKESYTCHEVSFSVNRRPAQPLKAVEMSLNIAVGEEFISIKTESSLEASEGWQGGKSRSELCGYPIENL